MDVDVSTGRKHDEFESCAARHVGKLGCFTDWHRGCTGHQVLATDFPLSKPALRLRLDTGRKQLGLHMDRSQRTQVQRRQIMQLVSGPGLRSQGKWTRCLARWLLR